MKGRILIVDDEPATRHTLQELLQLEGYDVESVAGGREALQALQQGKYDVMILDLRMPDVDGEEVLRRLGPLGLDVGVIMLTGHGSLESAIEALRHQAYDYLLKPVQPQDLLKSVRRTLERVQTQRRNRRLLGQLEQMLRQIQDEGFSGGAYSREGEVMPATLELPNGVVVDLGRRKLRYGKVEVHLTPTEARLLHILLQHRDQVLSHQILVEFVHGYRVEPWEAPEILRPIVSRLRRKLEKVPRGRQWIVSVRGTGYMLDWGAVIGEQKD